MLTGDIQTDDCQRQRAKTAENCGGGDAVCSSLTLSIAALLAPATSLFVSSIAFALPRSQPLAPFVLGIWPLNLQQEAPLLRQRLRVYRPVSPPSSTVSVARGKQ